MAGKTNAYMLMVGLFIIVQSGSCKKSGRDTIPPDDNNKAVQITVGTKILITDKFTNKGIPVVPMWKAPMATVDIRNGGGFPLLTDAQHTTVWRPTIREEGAYNHYACLIHHNGRFFAMWGNHELGEDAPGQRVLYATSDAWGNWTEARELFPAPGPVLPRSEDGAHLKPDRWAVVDGMLYAITYMHGSGIYPIARSVHNDGTLGEYFLVRSLPSNGTLPVFMQGMANPNGAPGVAGKIISWYTTNDLISWWARSGEGIPSKAVDNADLIESFTYRTKDNVLVLMQRNWGTSSNPVHNNRIYVSFNDGTGGWGKPYPSDIPDAPSRAQAIRLENGTVLLIGNQNVPYYDQALYLDRDPITISVSKDGYSFDRVFALKTNSPSTFLFSGVGGRNPGYAYSSSVVHNGFLYTLYSIGKEQMGISRVPVTSLTN